MVVSIVQVSHQSAAHGSTSFGRDCRLRFCGGRGFHRHHQQATSQARKSTHSTVNRAHSARQKLTLVRHARLYTASAKPLVLVLDAFCAQAAASAACDAGSLLLGWRDKQVVAGRDRGDVTGVKHSPFLLRGRQRQRRHFATAVSEHFSAFVRPKQGQDCSPLALFQVNSR